MFTDILTAVDTVS